MLHLLNMVLSLQLIDNNKELLRLTDNDNILHKINDDIKIFHAANPDTSDNHFVKISKADDGLKLLLNNNYISVPNTYSIRAKNNGCSIPGTWEFHPSNNGVAPHDASKNILLDTDHFVNDDHCSSDKVKAISKPMVFVFVNSKKSTEVKDDRKAHEKDEDSTSSSDQNDVMRREKHMSRELKNAYYKRMEESRAKLMNTHRNAIRTVHHKPPIMPENNETSSPEPIHAYSYVDGAVLPTNAIKKQNNDNTAISANRNENYASYEPKDSMNMYYSAPIEFKYYYTANNFKDQKDSKQQLIDAYYRYYNDLVRQPTQTMNVCK